MSEYLNKETLKGAAEFVNGPIWADIKRVLLARKPSGANFNDEPHVAAAKGFARDAWDRVIEEIERLPRDLPDKPPDGLFDRPAIDPRD